MSVSALELQPSVAAPRSATRIEALDWTKGALVVLMVIYHSINYSAFRPMAFKYLAFLPESFILIAGFIVGQVYAAKYDLGTWKPYFRLSVRGLKLLVLFLILNIGYCIAHEHDVIEGLWNFGDRSEAILLSGNGRQGIFEVLLPIAYFLLLAPALLWARSRARAAVVIAALATVVLCVLLERRGVSSKNLSLLSAGIMGMAAGLIRIDSINRFANRWYAVIAVYTVYRLCSYFDGENYSVQMFGAFASLMLLYAVALHLDCGSWIGSQMVMFGRYSLLGYLAQIPLIQLLVHVFRRPAHWVGVGEVTVATTILLFLVLLTVQWVRKQIGFADRIYKFIFA